MKQPWKNPTLLAFAFLLASATGFAVLHARATDKAGAAEIEKAVLARLDDIQKAAEALDADKVFSFVLDNSNGALVRNGRVLLTRDDALESTRRGFQAIQKVSYTFNQRRVTVLSPTSALVLGEGSSSATTLEGRSVTTPFVQSVVLVLTNGGWKVLHTHQSSAAPR